MTVLKRTPSNWTRVPRVSVEQQNQNALDRKLYADFMNKNGIALVWNRAPHANRPTRARLHKSRKYPNPVKVAIGAMFATSIYKRPFKLIRA